MGSKPALKSSVIRWSAEAVQAREQAREEERRRLARELHDELGQVLTGLKMDLSWIDHRLQDGSTTDEIRTKVGAMLEHVDAAIRTVRAIVTDLRPQALDQLGLVAALEWQAEAFARRAGLRCRFSSTTDQIDLDRGRATAVFRMFQEMLTNVARHANASHIGVTLRQEGDRLILAVRDNGRGVNPQEAVLTQSCGLLGMRERALLLDGSLDIASGARGGTTVTVTVPLSNRRSTIRPSEQF